MFQIASVMNSTVSAHLPRTVNQLQTFWKNASVRTKNRFKDVPQSEYDQLPPLTAKILQLADEASAAYQNSAMAATASIATVNGGGCGNHRRSGARQTSTGAKTVGGENVSNLFLPARPAACSPNGSEAALVAGGDYDVISTGNHVSHAGRTSMTNGDCNNGGILGLLN